MRETPLILIVDDLPDNRQILRLRLQSQGYDTAEACDGEAALQATADLSPDLILLDVMMPKLDGFEVCRRLRADPGQPFIPIVLVTARSEVDDMVSGLEAGANDYLTKPVEKAALIARVRSMLRIKLLHDQVQDQRSELERWNAELADRVAEQVETIERTNRLRRFLPKQVAELVISAGPDADMLGSRRGSVTVLFADLRGFTAYANAVPPEQVIAALNLFHQIAGPLIDAHGGTLERFLGDGLLVLFNAPMAQDDPVGNAAALAREMQSAFEPAMAEYQTPKCRLSLGIGIATGTATLGQIGFEGRVDYAAIGPAPNLAARLCSRAGSRQILLCQASAKHLSLPLDPAGPFDLKGFGSAVPAFQLT